MILNYIFMKSMQKAAANNNFFLIIRCRLYKLISFKFN